MNRGRRVFKVLKAIKATLESKVLKACRVFKVLKVTLVRQDFEVPKVILEKRGHKDLKAILDRLVLLARRDHKVFKARLVLKEKMDIRQLKVLIIGLPRIKMKLSIILQKILIIKLRMM